MHGSELLIDAILLCLFWFDDYQCSVSKKVQCQIHKFATNCLKYRKETERESKKEDNSVRDIYIYNM